MSTFAYNKDNCSPAWRLQDDGFRLIRGCVLGVEIVWFNYITLRRFMFICSTVRISTNDRRRDEGA
jgi:hypothetical protein